MLFSIYNSCHLQLTISQQRTIYSVFMLPLLCDLYMYIWSALSALSNPMFSPCCTLSILVTAQGSAELNFFLCLLLPIGTPHFIAVESSLSYKDSCQQFLILSLFVPLSWRKYVKQYTLYLNINFSLYHICPQTPPFTNQSTHCHSSENTERNLRSCKYLKSIKKESPVLLYLCPVCPWLICCFVRGCLNESERGKKQSTWQSIVAPLQHVPSAGKIKSTRAYWTTHTPTRNH